MKQLIYLASPYLNRGQKPPRMVQHAWEQQCREIERFRYQWAIDATAWLMNQGYSVISPIVLTHPIAVKHDLPKGSEYWMQFDEVLLSKCDIIVNLLIDGWKESPGMQRENEIAKQLGLKQMYMTIEGKGFALSR